jgi:hypothetical protein
MEGGRVGSWIATRMIGKLIQIGVEKGADGIPLSIRPIVNNHGLRTILMPVRTARPVAAFPLFPLEYPYPKETVKWM